MIAWPEPIAAACRKALPLLVFVLLGLPVAAGAEPARPVEAPLEPPQLVTDVRPIFPPALLARELRGTVLLELDISTEGRVAQAKVVESAGPEFDAAALAAGQQLVFTPARQAGKPVAVRIRFRYAFEPEVRLDRRPDAPSQGRYDRRGAEDAPAGFSSLQGTLVERGTGRPVAGALVTLPGLAKETVTDGDGRFRFGLLPPGAHALYVPEAEHKPLRSSVTIARGQTATVRLRAERLSYTVYRATAEGPPEPGGIARRSLGVEEIQRIPGVYGDSFRVVQNLPGVARPSAGSGLLVVRGSAPLDTWAYIEGVHVPLLYHFGGAYSVINTDMLEAIDFFPGSYAVRFGRQTGGLLQARLATPRDTERWRGYLETNLFHTGVLASGPIGKDTHLTFAARRSYIDLVLNSVVPYVAEKMGQDRDILPFTVAPRYYDGQIKLDHRLGRATDLTLFFFGSDDALAAALSDPPPAFPDARGEIETTMRFAALLGVVRHRGQGWTSSTTLGLLLAQADAGLGELLRMELTGQEQTLRQDFTFGDGPVQIRTGLDVMNNPFEAEVFAPQIPTAGERGQMPTSAPDAQDRVFVSYASTLFSPAAYFDAVLRLDERWEVVPGVRLDLYRGQSQGETFSPRINARYRLHDQWTFKGATGLGSQRPQPHEIGDSFGNPALVPIQSFESAGGFEVQITDSIDLDLQGFHKTLDHVVVVPEGLPPTPPFVGSASGRIIGLELLARHKPVGRFFGWLAYTLQRATRIDAPGEPERLFGWDQTHILTALGSYKLPRDWEIGARFRLVTGNPTTPVITAVWNEKTDTYTRVRSTCENCARLPTFHQLDVRIDKKWVYDSWMFNAYLDVQNVYNQGNPESVRYNFDATQHTYATGLPIIPSLGVRAEF